MAAPLMKSVSGIRGIVGESFTPELLVSAGAAFASYARYGTVVVGRDSRPTGEAVAMNMISVLLLSGCDVVDIGVVPTPTVQVMVEELNAAGGIVISASHNPVEWNALKLINSSGTFLNPADIKKLFALMEKEPVFKKWNKVGKLTVNNEANALHIKRVLDVVNVKNIKKKKFHVVLDAVNGAGSIITPELLKSLNCRVTMINCTPDGIFPRGAEPLPENLNKLSETVIKSGADIGFAQDPDADRLAIVDEKGRPIGEEYTVTLVADHLLQKEKGRVVVNLSTTKAVEDIAARHGVPFSRAKVGEINVVEEMRKKGAKIGGEGNGGVISPEVHLGRDSLAGIVYVLEMMSLRNRKVSEIMDEMPAYFMKKGKVSLKNTEPIGNIISRISDSFKNEKLSQTDGLRIDFKKSEEFKNGWVHLRSSNTEPVFRIIAESDNPQKTEKIYKYFAGIIK
ncbi:MAG TPA: phosphoglucosamine mutase [Spirochaetota bacterium]|nr:phosphoglucosamine mutase [Spirochaetota bacterium]